MALELRPPLLGSLALHGAAAALAVFLLAVAVEGGRTRA